MAKKETLKEWAEFTKQDKRETATRNAYKSYLNSTDYRLSDVYGVYSVFKARAFDWIVEEMQQFNGYGLKIISYNPQMFTCGYLAKIEDEIYFIRHTRDYRDCIQLRYAYYETRERVYIQKGGLRNGKNISKKQAC